MQWIWRLLPLTARVVLSGLVFSGVIWFVLDVIQNKDLRALYEADAAERLRESAREDRLRFHRAIKAHAAFAEIVARSQGAGEHFRSHHPNMGTLPANKEVVVDVTRGFPRWMPSRATMRSLYVPDYLLVLDPVGRAHHLYHAPGERESPPKRLLSLSRRTLLQIQNGTAIVRLGGEPFLIAASPVKGGKGPALGSILVASRIDSHFLINSQGFHLTQGSVVAIFSGEPEKVLASSDPARVPLEAETGQLTEIFLITDREILDFGMAELEVTFATLMPRVDFEGLLDPVLTSERRNRAIMAAGLVGFFLIFVGLLSQRMRRLSQRVAGFARDVFGVDRTQPLPGDEIRELERQTVSLVTEVLMSRDALERETREKMDMAQRHMEVEAENTRLHLLSSVSDALGVGVIRLVDDEPVAETSHMKRFIAQCGPIDRFVAASEGRGLLELTDITRVRRLFQITRPPYLNETVFLVQDVTLQKSTEEALQAAKDKAEQANEAKTRFLAAASHDLRQPLQALHLFMGLLEKKVLDGELRPIVEKAGHSVEALEGLLGALLDISQLEAGIIQPKPEDFELDRLIRRMEREFTPLAKEKGVEFRTFEPSRTCCIRTDPLLLERIVRNLLTNALRYTEKGGILLGFRCRGERLRIEVWDTGVGIPEDTLHKVFRDFYQVDNPSRDRRKGLGLGLAIVQRLSQLLEHPIRVKSRLGRGSVFAIDVPLADREAVPEPVPEAAQTERLAGKTIALVDDEDDILDAASEALRALDCTVVTAHDRRELKIGIKATPNLPDLIIADYRLAGEDTGTAVVEWIRGELNAQIPALLITGDTDPSRLRSAVDSGLQLLHKPVNFTTLVNTAARLIAD